MLKKIKEMIFIKLFKEERTKLYGLERDNYLYSNKVFSLEKRIEELKKTLDDAGCMLKYMEYETSKFKSGDLLEKYGMFDPYYDDEKKTWVLCVSHCHVGGCPVVLRCFESEAEAFVFCKLLETLGVKPDYSSLCEDCRSNIGYNE